MSILLKDFNRPEIKATSIAETSGYIRLYDLEDSKPDPAWGFDTPRNRVTDALALIERELKHKSECELTEILKALDTIRKRLTE